MARLPAQKATRILVLARLTGWGFRCVRDTGSAPLENCTSRALRRELAHRELSSIMAAVRKRSVPDDRQVFLNCPFDDDYYPLPRAAVFTIHACEFTARIALENTGSESVRLDRLVEMIRECQCRYLQPARTIWHQVLWMQG